ncbi:MAG: hypothetical protein QXP59_07260 [Saccharolobus sp.]
MAWNTIDPKTLNSTILILKDRFRIKNVIFIADRAFGRSNSLDLLDQDRYITAAYRVDMPYRNVLMKTDFTDGMVINDLIRKEVSINVKDVMNLNLTPSQIKRAENRKYIAVYNRERKDLDLSNLNVKIETVKEKLSRIVDRGELKKLLEKLRIC